MTTVGRRVARHWHWYRPVYLGSAAFSTFLYVVTVLVVTR